MKNITRRVLSNSKAPHAPAFPTTYSLYAVRLRNAGAHPSRAASWFLNESSNSIARSHSNAAKSEGTQNDPQTNLGQHCTRICNNKMAGDNGSRFRARYTSGKQNIKKTDKEIIVIFAAICTTDKRPSTKTE